MDMHAIPMSQIAKRIYFTSQIYSIGQELSFLTQFQLIASLSQQEWWDIDMDFLMIALQLIYIGIEVISWKRSRFNQELTHCGLVTPYGDRYLGQHWLR